MTEEMKSVMSDREYFKATKLRDEWLEGAKFEMPKEPTVDDKEAITKFGGKGIPLEDSVKPVSMFEQAVFTGSQPNKFNSDKNDWIFTKDGKELVVNSSGHFDFLMSKISRGNVVNAMYKGFRKIETGPRAGKYSHQFDLKYKPGAPVVEQPETPAAEADDGVIPF
jgi:hypothetical protein